MRYRRYLVGFFHNTVQLVISAITPPRNISIVKRGFDVSVRCMQPCHFCRRCHFVNHVFLFVILSPMPFCRSCQIVTHVFLSHMSICQRFHFVSHGPWHFVTHVILSHMSTCQRCYFVSHGILSPMVLVMVSPLAQQAFLQLVLPDIK